MTMPWRRGWASQNVAARTPQPAGGAATFNPSDKSSNVTLSNTNLTATSAAANSGARSITSHSTGKWGFTYSALSGDAKIGICLSTDSLTVDIASQPGAYALYAAGSQVYHNGGTSGMPSPDGNAGTTGAWVIDFDAQKAWFYNSTTAKWNNAVVATDQDPATGVGGFTIAADTYFAVFCGNSTDGVTVNFATPTLPSGFNAWG